MEFHLWENTLWQPKVIFLTDPIVRWVTGRISILSCVSAESTCPQNFWLTEQNIHVRSGDQLVFGESSSVFIWCISNLLMPVSYVRREVSVHLKCVQIFSFSTRWKGFTRLICVLVVVAAFFAISSNHICLKQSGWTRVSCCWDFYIMY